MYKITPYTLALLIASTGPVLAQKSSNPWNPYRTFSNQSTKLPRFYQEGQNSPATPLRAVPTPRLPSKFAPADLDQKLSTAPDPQRTGPFPDYAPNTNYSSEPQGNAYNYGAVPQGYGYNFGPAPHGYNNSFPGYGPSGPIDPFGFPGGLGGFGPFPGNLTNGGIPGFIFTPFGFF